MPDEETNVNEVDNSDVVNQDETETVDAGSASNLTDGLPEGSEEDSGNGTDKESEESEDVPTEKDGKDREIESLKQKLADAQKQIPDPAYVEAAIKSGVRRVLEGKTKGFATPLMVGSNEAGFECDIYAKEVSGKGTLVFDGCGGMTFIPGAVIKNGMLK